MNKQLRDSMSWMHTWLGLIFGSVLFAIFWMGTLSVFDREIDQWMIPELRSVLPEQFSHDEALLDIVDELHSSVEVQQWGATLPTKRSPYYRFFYQDGDGDFHNGKIVIGQETLIDKPGSLGATGFIFPFHYRLNISWKGLGFWLVGLSGMAMMALLVSGVILHKRIIKDFFTFRPKKNRQRASLDLHNLSSVLALPFHFIITWSGLIIFIGIYYPDAANMAYSDHENPTASYRQQAGDGFRRQATGQSADKQASLDTIIQYAEDYWQDKVGFIRAYHVGDSNAFIQLGRSVVSEVKWNIDKIYFDYQSGSILHHSEIKPMMQLQRFFVGLHFVQFDHWLLRWLYFIAGLTSCIMIATGFIYWLEARKRKRGYSNKQLRLVQAISIGSVSGIILATVAFFLSNRLLPENYNWYKLERAELEVAVFYLVWVASFFHAWCFPKGAIKHQCLLIALSALFAVIANSWLSYTELLFEELEVLLPIIGMDLMLLLLTAVAIMSAWRIKKAAPSNELINTNG